MGKKKIENKSNDEDEDSINYEEDPEMMLEKEREDDYLLKGEDDENFQNTIIESSNNITTEGKILLRAAKKLNTNDLDPNYNIDENYFYQSLSSNEWDEISNFLSLSSEKTEEEIKNFFSSYPKIQKGSDNINKLLELINKNEKNENYNKIINFYIKTYLKPKPSICECYFFPNIENEIKVVNMIRTCKKTLDIAIFTFTRDSISNAVKEAFDRKIKVRIIADDVCSNMWGSDIRKLAAYGIFIKTDNSQKYHMHHKFAILDESVVVTGSFNWTAQAIKYNQENILFYENKDIALKYVNEFNRLWNSFNTVVSQEDAIKFLEEEEEKKKIEREKREEEKKKKEEEKNKEKELKKKEKENEKKKKDDIKKKEKEKIQKEKEKIKKEKNKEKEKIKKQKEKEKNRKEKKKNKRDKQKVKKKEKEIKKKKVSKKKTTKKKK